MTMLTTMPLIIGGEGAMFMSTKRDGSATGYDGEHGPARRGRLRGRRGWAILAAVAVAASSAAGMMVLEAGTVLAPSPVVTTQPLTGYNGASAAAVYENSGTPTRVLRWSNTAMYAPNLAVGTPCSLTALAVDQTAYYVILASGPFRKCD
jgi:hypothetical protein